MQAFREEYEPADTADRLWDDWATSARPWSRWRDLARQPKWMDMPITYELALAGKELRRPCVVYVGGAKRAKQRLDRYAASGSHIKELFGEARRLGYRLVYRTRPHATELAAFLTEARHLRTFNYAWNKVSNGDRRSTEDAVARCVASPRPDSYQLSHLTAARTAALMKRYGATDAERAAYEEGLSRIRSPSPKAAAYEPPGAPKARAAEPRAAPTAATAAPAPAPRAAPPPDPRGRPPGFPKLTAAEWRAYGPARPRVT